MIKGSTSYIRRAQNSAKPGKAGGDLSPETTGGLPATCAEEAQEPAGRSKDTDTPAEQSSSVP